MPDPALHAAVLNSLVLMAEVMANPKPLTPDLVLAWELVLEQANVRPEEIAPAAARLMSSQTFFPTPADLIRAVHPAEDGDAAAELGWQLVLTCIRERGGYASITAADLGGDEAALWAVGRMGWERLCAELEAHNRALFRAEFIRTYNAAQVCGGCERYLPGRNERLNDANGRDLNPALVGRPDWPALPGRAAGDARPLRAPAPCAECGSRGRHLAWCSELDQVWPLRECRPPRPLPGGFTALAAVLVPAGEDQGDLDG